ncbi:SdpI family protein [Ekhidna sp.]|uniref:SdpI family protein n=1 Tax=Ekhidna sp. TaxID=2608089 RepID=UPI0035191F98
MSATMILSNLAVGPLLLAFAILFKVFPPKKINALYGYRTPRSMKSQESWNAANQYANDLMMWVAIITIIFQIGLHFLFPRAVAILTSCGIMTALLVGSLFVVENFLKRNFDENGVRKSGQ